MLFNDAFLRTFLLNDFLRFKILKLLNQVQKDRVMLRFVINEVIKYDFVFIPGIELI